MADRFLATFAKGFWLLIAGSACIALGLAVIGLAWWGAAHTREVTDQIPYLISGGIGGLALVVIGAALTVTFYVAEASRVARRSPHQDAEAAQDLPRVHAPLVVTVAGGTTYHRPGCPLASGKIAAEHEPAAAIDLGYMPCPVCEPSDEANMPDVVDTDAQVPVARRPT